VLGDGIDCEDDETNLTVKAALKIEISVWDASLKEYFKACAH
jgi:hypothetical protein